GLCLDFGGVGGWIRLRLARRYGRGRTRPNVDRVAAQQEQDERDSRSSNVQGEAASVTNVRRCRGGPGTRWRGRLNWRLTKRRSEEHGRLVRRFVRPRKDRPPLGNRLRAFLRSDRQAGVDAVQSAARKSSRQKPGQRHVGVVEGPLQRAWRRFTGDGVI